MEWIYIIFSGLFEMAGVLMIHIFHRQKSFLSALFMLLGFAASFAFLTLAMQTLPMGTAYAVWTGIGAAGAAVFGMVFYKESKDGKRIFFILLILASVIGIKLIT